MIIVFACYSGTHAAVITGALYLGIISPIQIHTWKQLKKISHFDAVTSNGGLRLLGRTNSGDIVYTVAVGNDGQVAGRAVYSLVTILGRNNGEVEWVDLSTLLNVTWKLGSFLRQYKWTSTLGYVILDYSIKRDYMKIKKMVKELKQKTLASG